MLGDKTNMKTQFLSEDLFADSELLVESSDDGKELFLSGIIMQGGIKNRNGRIYSVNEISESVRMINERLDNGESIMGELDHPPSLTINLDRVSHIITEARMEGNNAYGKMKILNTPMGGIARTLIDAGVKIGVSSRGKGAVGRGGNVSGFVFMAMDIVATPSAPDAYPESVMEALTIATSGSDQPLMEVADMMHDDTQAQKFFNAEILKFIRGLSR